MKKVILIADDSPTIRKFVTFSLTMQGFEVISAIDGMEAMELLPKYKVDLVITDLNMPNMDGFELIKTIRQNEDYKDIPIIILSSLAGSEEIERGMSSGANSYMVKPFDPKRIQYEVAKYLN
ncbi:MAG TPA: response regulator [Melioribacteraceae bacterium]|nr:response regulator [Melioribacteraceae bacterium]